jgi:hypothetical protein
MIGTISASPLRQKLAQNMAASSTENDSYISESNPSSPEKNTSSVIGT